MTMFRRVVQWILAHPGHKHYYALHVERDTAGNVKPFWLCKYPLCDKEIEVDEWN